MDHKKTEFLLKDFEFINLYRISFSTMRLGALGASLTILGLVISLTTDAEFPGVFGVYAILIIVVFACIRIIAAINRGIFVFGNHIKWLEKEMGIMGFSTYWGYYLKKNIKDSGSYAFVVASRLINFSITIYVLIGIISFLDIQKLFSEETVLGLILITFSVIIYIWNEIHIRKELDPRGFQDRISNGLNEARTKSIKLF